MCGARGGGAHGLRNSIGERCDIGKLGSCGELGIFGHVCLVKQQHIQQRCGKRYFVWQHVNDGKRNACSDW